MADYETIYRRMSEGEKEVFDLMMDYGLIEEAKKIMAKKQVTSFPQRERTSEEMSDLEQEREITYA